MSNSAQAAPIYVLPNGDVLTDAGCVWESILMGKGWNDLPAESKPGRIVQMYSDGTFDIHFDALDHTATGVYLDELQLIPPSEG